MSAPKVLVYESSVGSTTQTTLGEYYSAFVGKGFVKGEGNKPLLVSSLSNYKSRFGLPTDANYNEWFQVEQFLKYSNTVYVVRAIDETGVDNTVAVTALSADALADAETISVDSVTGLFDNAFIKLDNQMYTIVNIAGNTLTITPGLMGPVLADDVVYLATPAYNAIAEIEKMGGTIIDASTIKNTLKVVPNAEDYKEIELGIEFGDVTNSKLKFIAKNPGSWANNTIEIGIIKPSDFATTTNTVFSNAINSYYDYIPSAADNEIGIIIKEVLTGDIEIFTASLTPGAQDASGYSVYVEDIINSKSNYVYVKDNTALTTIASKMNGDEITLTQGNDGAAGKDEIIRQYTEQFGNPEELSIDFFIANEIASKEVVELASQLGECLAICGAKREDVVGLKREKATENLVTYCSTGEFNISNKYGALYGNYAEIYDTYNDKYRWINIAGGVTGLRTKANMEVGPWSGNFGLEQYGQLLGINRLAFNPDSAQRDLIYKYHCNPVVSFAGQGNAIVWGNRTLLKKNEPFSKVHVRTAFNNYEKVIRQSAKYVIGKPNDSITRSLFTSTVLPVFENAQAKRGIQEFQIFYPEITDDTIFEAVFYIKPVGLVEVIKLYFTAVDNSVSISEIVGKV